MLTEEQKKQLELQDEKILQTLNNIDYKIVVFSGKGGVGKTTISTNIACGLVIHGFKVGTLDADITGPNVPQMMGVTDKLDTVDGKIIPLVKNGIKVVSLASMIAANSAIIWRGPLRSKMLNQFIGNVEWGELDFLIADLPPGTGDEVITMTQILKPDMAIIVTTPQAVSLIDSRRAITMAKSVNIPKIGLLENMSGFKCPSCGYDIDLFGVGGGCKQADEMNIDFLGSLQIESETRISADEGKPFILETYNHKLSNAMMKIVYNVETLVIDEVKV